MKSLPYLDELHAHGRAWLARGARRAIELAGIELDALPEAALVDPRVHAFFYGRRPKRPLAQLLVGFLPDAARPARTRVVADSSGIVHLPGLGHARGLAPRAEASLRWDGEAWSIAGAAIVAPTRVGGLEIARVPDALWLRVLRPSAPLAIASTFVRHRGALSRALSLLRAIDPRWYDGELVRDCALLVLFASTTLGSCANVSAYRAAFLRCDDDATAPFFCEDLAHQIGHATFHAVTADPRRCFRIPPATPLAAFGGRPGDHRTLFDALHGNFTMTRMIEVLDALLVQPLEPLERAEVIGRIAQALWKLECGLEDVDDARLFTPEVRAMHLAMRELAATMRARHGARVADVDLGEQPYAFSWSTYRRRNGIEPRAAAGY